MQNNVMYGIEHWTKGAYARVRDMLQAFKPLIAQTWMPAFLRPRLGLQLPQKYTSNSMSDAFMYPLACDMEKIGFSILPLDDAAPEREAHIAELARKIVHREMKRSELERALAQQPLEHDAYAHYTDPSSIRAKKEQQTRCQEALWLADTGKEHVEEYWLRTNATRETRMLLRMELYRPHSAVLASTHVSSMKERFERLGYRIAYL